MLVEAKGFLSRAALVPILAAGAMALESIVSTPVAAEAGGCRGEKVVTSGNISPEGYSALEQICTQSALINQKRIMEQQTNINNHNTRGAAAVAILLGLGFGLAIFKKWL